MKLDDESQETRLTEILVLFSLIQTRSRCRLINEDFISTKIIACRVEPQNI